jgi:dTDP-4-dehydrorhamnose reductase
MPEWSTGKVLVVGAGGQVGSQLLRVLGDDAVPSSRERGLIVDLENLETRRESLKTQLEAAAITAILCVGGMTDVERCESEPAKASAINIGGAATLASIAAELSLPFVYFSTDYVFDGESGPYGEDCSPNPVSVYGRTKLGGEIAVRDAHPAPLILRTTVVFGPDSRKKNFAVTLAAALREKKRLCVASDQVSTPTYNFDLARTTLVLLRAQASGIFNVVGPEIMSRCQFAVRLATSLGFDPSMIEPTPSVLLKQVARRPLNAGLLTTKLRGILSPGEVPRSLEASLRHWKIDCPTAVPL